MSTKNTFDSASKTKTLDSNSKLRLSKQNLMLKPRETKTIYPKFSEKQIAEHMGISNSTLTQNGNVNYMNSLYMKSRKSS